MLSIQITPFSLQNTVSNAAENLINKASPHPSPFYGCLNVLSSGLSQRKTCFIKTMCHVTYGALFIQSREGIIVVLEDT